MSLEFVGDLPTWLQAIGTTVQAGQMVRAERDRRAAAFAHQLESETGLSGEELAEAIAADPLVLEAFEVAFESAVRSATEAKRWLLGRVLSNALLHRNLDDVIERVPFFLRTVNAIEPPHITLLVLIATPDIEGDHLLRQTPLEGALRRQEIDARWPQPADLIDPLLRGLEREGLVSDVAIGTWGYVPAWATTAYGRAFMEFLPGGPLDSANVGIAQVVVRYDATAQGSLVVLNIGPAPATDISIEVPSTSQGAPLVSVVEPFDLAPMEERAFETLAPSAELSPPYRVTLRWRDRITHRERSRVVERQA